MTSRCTRPCSWAASSASPTWSKSAHGPRRPAAGRPPARPPQVVPDDVAHRDEQQPVGVAGLVDRDDVRVVQRRGQPRLLDEPLLELLLAAELRARAPSARPCARGGRPRPGRRRPSRRGRSPTRCGNRRSPSRSRHRSSASPSASSHGLTAPAAERVVRREPSSATGAEPLADRDRGRERARRPVGSSAAPSPPATGTRCDLAGAAPCRRFSLRGPAPDLLFASTATPPPPRGGAVDPDADRPAAPSRTRGEDAGRRRRTTALVRRGGGVHKNHAAASASTTATPTISHTHQAVPPLWEVPVATPVGAGARRGAGPSSRRQPRVPRPA